MSYTIEIADRQQQQGLDLRRLREAVEQVLKSAGIARAEISVAIVDNRQMHDLNRQYLDHDYPTDVLSFVLAHDADAGSLEGEIIVSADYAAREAGRFGWSADDELLLYIVHGALHLVGHDDQTPQGQQAMRQAEAEHLARWGLKHRY